MEEVSNVSGRLISSAHPERNNITYTQRAPFNNAENILTDSSKYNERQRGRRVVEGAVGVREGKIRAEREREVRCMRKGVLAN